MPDHITIGDPWRYTKPGGIIVAKDVFPEGFATGLRHQGNIVCRFLWDRHIDTACMALMQYEHDMVVTYFEASLRHIDTELGRVFTNEPKDVEYDTAVEACRHIDTFLESIDFEEEEEEGFRCTLT